MTNWGSSMRRIGKKANQELSAQPGNVMVIGGKEGEEYLPFLGVRC